MNFTRSLGYPLLSLVLGYLTLYGIGTLKYLPYSPFRGALLDALTFPGLIIAGLFYPEGVHTGSGSAAAVYVGFVANIFVYASLWFLAIQVIRRIRAKKSRT